MLTNSLKFGTLAHFMDPRRLRNAALSICRQMHYEPRNESPEQQARRRAASSCNASQLLHFSWYLQSGPLKLGLAQATCHLIITKIGIF